MLIHPTAIIDPGAEIGNDVEIGPYSVVAGDVRICDGCRIGPHVVVHRYTTLGPGCRVHAQAVIGDIPQDMAFKEVPSYTEVGAQCTIREGVTIHRGTEEGSKTVVGDRCLLMGAVHIGHDTRIGNDVIMANATLLAGHVDVGDRVFMAGGSAVHQFTRVGRLAMLGGGSGCSRDLPPFCTSKPHHTNRILGLNRVGMERAGMSAEERSEVKAAFQLFYLSGLPLPEAVAKLAEDYTAGPAGEFASFVKNTERGVCRLGIRGGKHRHD